MEEFNRPLGHPRLTMSPVAILGVRMDLGAGRRGVDMGPSAIRLAQLPEKLEMLGVKAEDWGDLSVDIPEIAEVTDSRARFLPTILAACSDLAGRVKAMVQAGRVPLILGGDHSIAIGTLAGLHAAQGDGGLIWMDAHADLNIPATSPSGNVHGMPLAAILGAAGFSISGFDDPPWLDSSRVALIGTRALDPEERKRIEERGVAVFTMAEIDRQGIAHVMNDAIKKVSGPGFIHLSMDMDVVDPEIAPGVGTPVRGGLTYREAHLALELLAESGAIGSMEFVEVNPILDSANTTGRLAVELIASALGARTI